MSSSRSIKNRQTNDTQESSFSENHPIWQNSLFIPEPPDEESQGFIKEEPENSEYDEDSTMGKVSETEAMQSDEESENVEHNGSKEPEIEQHHKEPRPDPSLAWGPLNPNIYFHPLPTDWQKCMLYLFRVEISLEVCEEMWRLAMSQSDLSFLPRGLPIPQGLNQLVPFFAKLAGVPIAMGVVWHVRSYYEASVWYGIPNLATFVDFLVELRKAAEAWGEEKGDVGRLAGGMIGLLVFEESQAQRYRASSEPSIQEPGGKITVSAKLQSMAVSIGK